MKAALAAIAVLLACAVSPIYGQKDSLISVIKTANEDTNKVKALMSLSRTMAWSDRDSSRLLADQAVDLAFKLEEWPFVARALYVQGSATSRQDSIFIAISHYEEARSVYKNIGDEKGVAECYNALGNAYTQLADYPKALEYHLDALKIRERIGYEKGVAGSLNNIGNVYQHQEDYDRALKYFEEAKVMNIEQDNKPWLGVNLGNIGNTYYYTQRYAEAVSTQMQTLVLMREMENPRGIARCYTNLGIYYSDYGKPDSSEYCFKKSIHISDSLNAQDAQIYNYNGLGLLYKKNDRFTEALDKMRMANGYAKALNYPSMIQSTTRNLADIFESMGRMDSAFYYYKEQAALKDSIFNEDNASDMVRAQMRFDYEKERLEEALKSEEDSLMQLEEVKRIKMQHKVDQAEHKAEIARQNMIIYIGIVVLVLIAVFLVYTYRQYNAKKRLSEIVIRQNQEVSIQKSIIEEKHQEITDSINYAQRIQSAVLPALNTFKDTFPDSFVLFRPKDIVSGDFYWYKRVGDVIIFTVADCTGHGVPGAFMSVIGTNYIERIVEDNLVDDPSKALHILDERINRALSTEGHELDVNDGMDLALCAYHIGSRRLQFAGAKRPLFYIRNKELSVVRGSKFSIGGHDASKQFESEDLQLESGDQIYLFSDGFQDQFGGLNNKKIKLKKFKELLIENCHLSMQEQKAILNDFLDHWRGDLEQIDDVMVMGIRI